MIDPITGHPIDPRGLIPVAGFGGFVPIAEHRAVLAERDALRAECERLRQEATGRSAASPADAASIRRMFDHAQQQRRDAQKRELAALRIAAVAIGQALDMRHQAALALSWRAEVERRGGDGGAVARWLDEESELRRMVGWE